jgi:ubiquinone biosynthesis protein
MLVNAPVLGWHHILGEMMVYAGIIGTIIVWIGTVRRDQGRGRGRR